MTFNLRVAVIWTISDFPAFVYLFGFNTQRKLVCPICLADTCHRLIQSKISYIGHRSFLEMSHPWQNNKDFDGRTKRRATPRNFSVANILLQLEAIVQCVPGKATNRTSAK